MAFRQNPLLGYWHRMTMAPTAAEAAAEPTIAALGEPYRFQYPFLGIKYFADFALISKKIIIEIDGASHETPAQMEKDLQHTLQVLKLGWRVARITNEQAFRNPAEAIARALDGLPSIDEQVVHSMAALGRLHRDYPNLLAADATKSKNRRQSALKASMTRRNQSTPALAQKLKRPKAANIQA